MGNYKPSGLKKIFKDILANNKKRKRKNPVESNGLLFHDTFGWKNNYCDDDSCNCNSCHCEDSCNSYSCNCKCSCDCDSCNDD